jgi:hypothetical protein
VKRPINFILQYDPAEILKLAAEYMVTFAGDDREMEQAGKRIAGGQFSRANLETVCRWKSPRRLDLLVKNTDAEIEQALKLALNAADVKSAVNALLPLPGVGVKMASAILTAIDPKRYTVLDFRALEALGVEDSEDLNLYVQYVEACRNMAKENGVSLRDFDRANWQWSKRKSELSNSEPKTPNPSLVLPRRKDDKVVADISETERLENEFRHDLLGILEREGQLGLCSTRFRQMLECYSGRETAKRLLRSEPPPNTFGYLRKQNRLDLSLEYYVVLPKYEPLFSEDERQIAEWRLKYGD